MGSGTLLVLLWCTVVSAQPGDAVQRLSSGAGAGEWSENGWSTRLRFLVPQQDLWPRVNTEETFDVLSRRYLLNHGFAIPITSEAGTFLIALQARERGVLEDPFTVSTLGQTHLIEQGSVRMTLRWLDRRQDEIEANVTWRYGIAAAKQPVTTVGISLRIMLPTLVTPWYLNGGLQADSDQGRQATVSLFTAHQAAFGSSIAANAGITMRELPSHFRRTPGLYPLNWSVNWNCGDRVRVGVLFNYYLDVHEIDAAVFAELNFPVRVR